MVINEYQHAVPNELPEIILQRDISLDGERFLEADIIYYSGNKTAFVLSWNHILMDVMTRRDNDDYFCGTDRAEVVAQAEAFLAGPGED